MPFTSGTTVPEFLYVQLVPLPFTFQPALLAVLYAPPGMVMSTGIAPVESTIRKRTPLVSGSMVGDDGMAVKKLLKLSLSSVAGRWSLVRVSFCLLGTVGTMVVHGSQASPSGSLSLLSCEVLAIVTQLSTASHTVSLSVSGCPVS